MFHCVEQVAFNQPKFEAAWHGFNWVLRSFSQDGALCSITSSSQSVPEPSPPLKRHFRLEIGQAIEESPTHHSQPTRSIEAEEPDAGSAVWSDNVRSDISLQEVVRRRQPKTRPVPDLKHLKRHESHKCSIPKSVGCQAFREQCLNTSWVALSMEKCEVRPGLEHHRTPIRPFPEGDQVINQHQSTSGYRLSSPHACPPKKSFEIRPRFLATSQ